MRNTEAHDTAVRDDERKKVMDEFGILHGEDAKRLHEYITGPVESGTEKQKAFFKEAIEITKPPAP